MDFKLKGKVAIVTGASRGLGKAIAIALAGEGATVAAVARSGGALDELASLHPGLIFPMVADMKDLGAMDALPTGVQRRFGRLDILVNNAGIAPASRFIDESPELMTEVLLVNVTAPSVLARAAGRIMIPQGSGKIVNIASISGILGKASLVAYSTSKGALIQFTKALSSEWSKTGVQVNAIAPGGFVTEAQAAVLGDPEVLRRRVRKIPLGRMADPTEIGALACFLASEVSNFVTGSIYVIDGGETARI